MEMPINIVPAPFGALVALYLGTHSVAIHRDCAVELDDQTEDNQLFYMIRPVVAWGFYRDNSGLVNHPMVADDSGKLVFAGLRNPEDTTPVLKSMRDFHATNYALDSVCTPFEAEARIEEITNKYPNTDLVRWSCAAFGLDASLDLPADFRL